MLVALPRLVLDLPRETTLDQQDELEGRGTLSAFDLESLEESSLVHGVSDFVVSLDGFSGPLDLLLHLVREDEIDIANIPIARIADQLRAWTLDPAIDVILSTGGTGLTGRDVTVEAHRDVYEKEIEAFATVFTIVSMQKIGTSAVQSRATGGVANGTYLFALPGSPGACKDAWDEILKFQLDFRHRPCNFVEILPRLDEHLRRK